MKKHINDPGLMFFGNSVMPGLVLDELRQFLVVVNDFLNKENESLLKKPLVLEDERPYLFSEPFPNILYSSIIISTVSFLEREVRGFSELLRKAANCDLSMQDLAGSWIERFRKFAEKVVRLNFGINDALWQDIYGIIEVRNCLVHAGGNLSEFHGRKVVEQFCTRNEVVCLAEGILEPDYRIAQVVQNIAEKFIDLIYDAALTEYPRKK